jgi:hypothetical protein
MTESDEARSKDVPTSTLQRNSRFFWTTAALAIAAMLLLCAVLILVASAKG